MLKKIIVIFIVFSLIKYFVSKTNEKFTPSEMKNYKKMLKDNCNKAAEIRNKIKKMNELRCNPLRKGKTERDTINNKRLCYDDVYKEIVAELDTESNCVMDKLISGPSKVDSSKVSSKADSSKEKLEEGPEFINQFHLPTRDTKKSETLATTKFGDVSNNKFPAKGSYDNVGFSSDPSFLYQLSKNK